MRTENHSNNVVIEDIYELLPMQKGMLFHTLYDSATAAYFVQSGFVIQGALNVRAFKRAWQRILSRHAILRISIHWKEIEKPVQVVHREVSLLWDEPDWRGLSSLEQEKRLEVYLKADQERGFDLSSAPLMRMALIRTADDAHYFIWSRHHILQDTWSALLLLDELFTLYKAEINDRELQLPLPRPFVDYITWFQRQNLSEAEIYWRRVLKGFVTPNTINIGRASEGGAPDGVGYREFHFALPKITASRLSKICKEHRLTMKTIAYGGWAFLLSRYSGQKDVVFGSVVSGRPPDLEGVEKMIGVFINTLPVRVKMNDNQKVVDWLKQLQKEQTESGEYEYSPLMEIQKWSDVAPGTPLFETIFAFNYSQVKSIPEKQTASLQFRPIPSFGKSNYSIDIEVSGGEQLLLNIGYDANRYDEQTIARMCGHLGIIFEEIAENPYRLLSSLSLVTEAEIRQVKEEWNGTRTSYPRDTGVPELFEAVATQTPDAMAVICEGNHLSYGELNRRANSLAWYLREHGVRSEELVGVCVERSLEMVVGMLGILKSGGAYLPLDPTYPKERLGFMLSEASVNLLLTQKSLLGHLPSLDARIVCLDTEQEAIAQRSRENLGIEVTADNLAYVIYTSGSTGNPKGICIPHRGIVRLILNTNYVNLKPSDVIAQCSNFSFDAATFEIWGALLTGAQTVIIDKNTALSPSAFAAQIGQSQVTTLFLTTALFNRVVDAAPEAFAPLESLLFGGESVDPRWPKVIVDRFPWLRLLHVYGPTEHTTFTSWYPVKSVPETATTVPIGSPISNTQMYLLENNFSPVPINLMGEIFIGGDGSARGYLGSPDLTAEAFIPDPLGRVGGGRLYKTGDLGRYCPDGSVEFIGRIDSQVKIRGFRIELGEIEAELLRHASIKNAVVTVDQEFGEKRLVAYLVAEDGEQAEAPELRALLKSKLPEYMIPAHFIFLPALPLNENGKVNRKMLLAPERMRSDLGNGYQAPRDQWEAKLAKLWSEILNVDQVGVTDDFFELGGDSLSSVRLLSRIGKEFGHEPPLLTLFKAPTLAALADAVRRKIESQPRKPIVALQPKGARPPIFCIHPGSGNVMCYVPLARQLGEEQPFYGIQDPRIVSDPRLQKDDDFDLPLEQMAGEYLEALLAIQKTGPFYLAGWSFGGHVAFEMAQQLRDSGRDVALLAIIDTGSQPVIARLGDLMDDTEMLCTIAREMGSPTTVSELRLMTPDQQLSSIAEYLVQADLVERKDAWWWINRELKIFKARWRALDHYSPRRYPGRLTLFRAADLDLADINFFANEGKQLRQFYDDPAMGWSDFSAEPVEVHFTPGNHATMARDPHVEMLAQQLTACLAVKSL